MNLQEKIKQADNDPYDLMEIAKQYGVAKSFAESIGVPTYTYAEAWDNEVENEERIGEFESEEDIPWEVEDVYEEIELDCWIKEQWEDDVESEDCKKALVTILQDQIIQEEKEELAEALRKVSGETQSPELANATSTKTQRATRKRVM